LQEKAKNPRNSNLGSLKGASSFPKFATSDPARTLTDKPVFRKTVMTKPASTIAQFCADYQVSRTLLYELWKEGRGPVFFKVGRKTLISSHAAADWVKRMESESNPVTSFYQVLG
jgi:hypothetical protein